MVGRNWRVGLLAMMVGGAPALAQDKHADKPKQDTKPPAAKQDAKPAEKADGQPQMSEEENAWAAAAMPGPEHKMLANMVGKWDCKVKSFQGDQVVESTGTSESRAILGGRYIESVFKGQMGEMPFEGRGFDGYDNIAKKYVGVWMDSAGTSIFMQSGDFDPAKKEFNYTGEMLDPMTKKPMANKSVVRIIDENSHVFTMYMKLDSAGEWIPMVEITYTRAKAAPNAGA